MMKNKKIEIIGAQKGTIIYFGEYAIDLIKAKDYDTLIDRRAFALMYSCDSGEKWNPDQYKTISHMEIDNETIQS